MKFFNLIVISFIISILSVFVPTKQTIYTMYVSSNITQENINKFSDGVDTLIDKIIEKANNYNKGGSNATPSNNKRNK